MITKSQNRSLGFIIPNLFIIWPLVGCFSYSKSARLVIDRAPYLIAYLLRIYRLFDPSFRSKDIRLRANHSCSSLRRFITDEVLPIYRIKFHKRLGLPRCWSEFNETWRKTRIVQRERERERENEKEGRNWTSSEIIRSAIRLDNSIIPRS